MSSRIKGTPTEQVLLAIMEAGGEARPGSLARGTGLEPGDLAEVGEELRSLGLARPDASLAGEVALTLHGKQVAQHISRSRESGPDRADAVRRGILQWLTDTPGGESTDRFVGTESATAYGKPFTAGEVRTETEYLESKKLLEGVNTLSGGPYQPEITPEGRAALRSGIPVEEYIRGGSAYYHQQINSTSFGGDNYGGVQTGGSGNVMHSPVNPNLEQRRFVQDEISRPPRQRDMQALGVDAEPVREALEGVLTETTTEKATSSTVKGRIAEAMAVAATSETTRFVVDGLADVVRHITGAG